MLGALAISCRNIFVIQSYFNDLKMVACALTKNCLTCGNLASSNVAVVDNSASHAFVWIN